MRDYVPTSALNDPGFLRLHNLTRTPLAEPDAIVALLEKQTSSSSAESGAASLNLQ
jgi:hypothetical protein